jgi:hypothetical protein
MLVERAHILFKINCLQQSPCETRIIATQTFEVQEKGTNRRHRQQILVHRASWHSAFASTQGFHLSFLRHGACRQQQLGNLECNSCHAQKKHESSAKLNPKKLSIFRREKKPHVNEALCREFNTGDVTRGCEVK